MSEPRSPFYDWLAALAIGFVIAVLGTGVALAIAAAIDKLTSGAS